jgi:hypothetical protein
MSVNLTPAARGAVVAVIAVTGLLAAGVSAHADTSRSPRDPHFIDPQFNNQATLDRSQIPSEKLEADRKVLSRPAPPPQAIAPEDLPLSKSDLQTLKSDASTLAADIWCGNWLSDPNAVSLSQIKYGGGYLVGWTAPDPYNPNDDLWWQPLSGVSGANNVRYGWSKMYDVTDGTSRFLVNSQITTGWWDTSDNPHFCGWGSALARTISSEGKAYTAGVRQGQAVYIRAHGKPNYPGTGWIYPSGRWAL